MDEAQWDELMQALAVLTIQVTRLVDFAGAGEVPVDRIAALKAHKRGGVVSPEPRFNKDVWRTDD